MSKEIVGVFKYDLFPGMVAHYISGWEEDGGVVCENIGVFKPDSLIATFPKKQGEKIQKILSSMKREYHKGIDTLKTQLLKELFEEFPALEKK